MKTSSNRRYRVQTFDRTTGSEKWIVIEANDKDDAIELAVALDVVVGDAKLFDPQTCSDTNSAIHRAFAGVFAK
jgi:hypothetical protein